MKVGDVGRPRTDKGAAADCIGVDGLKRFWRQILAALGLQLWAVFPVQAEIKVGDKLPPLATYELTGGLLPSTEGKVVFLDFWASWCAPCKQSFPAYGRLQQELAEGGLVVLAVSVDKKPSEFAGFVQRHRPPFSTLHDVKQTLVKAVGVPAMPTGYLFDREGRLRSIHPGFHGKQTEEELRRLITELLKEGKTS
ncbi:MAG TPA: TlpA disulfide reductase family protein [Opitutaceae bacterium]|nr:TlpA disulfide reductase family protein [Opitutaceae bacterium]